MTPEETQEILLLSAFRLKVLMNKHPGEVIYSELEHIFRGLTQAIPLEFLYDLPEPPRQVELPRLSK